LNIAFKYFGTRASCPHRLGTTSCGAEGSKIFKSYIQTGFLLNTKKDKIKSLQLLRLEK
jgi:hypothetical protein